VAVGNPRIGETRTSDTQLDTYTKKHAAEKKEAHQEKGVVVIGYENIVRESSKELIKAYGTVLSRRMGLFVWGRILL
jgi:hypothetical protein